MSIKKELLNELTKQQLEELADSKGIKFNLSKVQKRYYANWDEREKIVDLMAEKESLTVKEIEEYLKIIKNREF